jgi:hypothetical protein
MARGVWADLWATEQEEKGKSFSGQDITEAAPKTPAWALKWARGVADKIVAMNQGNHIRNYLAHTHVEGDPWKKQVTLNDLYLVVKSYGFPHDEDQFGLLLGMQAASHGISWSDDTKGLPHDTIELPRTDFYRP